MPYLQRDVHTKDAAEDDTHRQLARKIAEAKGIALCLMLYDRCQHRISRAVDERTIRGEARRVEDCLAARPERCPQISSASNLRHQLTRRRGCLQVKRCSMNSTLLVCV